MTSSRLPLLLAFLTLLMGALALYCVVQLSRTRQELALARQQVLARDRVIFRQEGARQRAARDSTAQTVSSDTVKVEPPAAAVFADELGSLTGDQLSDLMKAGLPEDPEAFLKQDLMKHSQQLVGRQLTDARILTPHYALAASEEGYALMRYDVTGPGKVTWRSLDQAGR